MQKGFNLSLPGLTWLLGYLSGYQIGLHNPRLPDVGGYGKRGDDMRVCNCEHLQQGRMEDVQDEHHGFPPRLGPRRGPVAIPFSLVFLSHHSGHDGGRHA